MSSYILERDLLSSARQTTTTTTNHWIDVNSNQNLLGNVVYQRNETETRKMIADLQDQLKMLRHDVEKKDQLITELSSFREDKHRGFEAAKLDAIFSVERAAAENAKKEAASWSAKYETITNEFSETKIKVQARDERINELKRDIETLKGENAALNSLVISLRGKIKELETDLGGWETAASKSGITLTVIQRENKEYQTRNLELESRIRTHMHEREEAERKTEVIYKKLDELASHLTVITGIEIPNTAAGLDILITKITEIVNENSMVKGKFMTQTEKVTHIEAELKANRETIQRLVNEMNKFEKDSVATKTLTDTLKAERDSVLNTKSLLEREIETLKDRLNNIQTAWQASRTELETKEGKYSSIEVNMKQMEYDALYAKNCLTALREQVATLLSDGYVKVEANDEQIKEKVKLLMTSSKDRGLMIASMEGKMQQLANQLTDQINLYKELESKYHHGESRVIELETKIKHLDGEYCANEVLRDNLKSDRIKYLTFLEKMGHILKIDHISADVGLDMNVDILIARAEQLVKMEGDSIQDKQTNIYNLQRKVKSLKEQLDNKELHLDLLRKKLTSLEEEKCGKTSLEKEVDDHIMMSKKLKVKVDKLTQQLSDLKTENTDLKAQLLDSNALKGRNCEQDREIHKLLNRITELEDEKVKQSNRILKLRDEVDSVNHEVTKTRTSTDSAVTALSQELRQFKHDLERAKQRENQLLDFRGVIAKMLGLDITSLAVPDYEIIARIERLIATVNGTLVHAQQSVPVNMVPVHTGYTTVHTNPHEYLYSSSSSILADATSISPTRRHHHHHRQRSPSPVKQQHISSSSHHHHHHHASSSSSAKHERSRSKSPRKVTIDPNSY